MMRTFARWLRPGLGQLVKHAPKPLSFDAADPTVPGPPTRLPRISIVVPSYNQAEFLERTLLSVLDQAYPDLELIVVDGGSTDATLSVIHRYAGRLTWWVSEPDGGQTAAINKGFARSTGEVMGWLNSDDLLAPGALHRIAASLQAHPGIDALYGDRILIDEDDREIGRWLLPGHAPDVLSWVDFVPQETLYWRRSAWDAVGASLDESFRFAMDWDLLLRLRSAGQRFIHLPVALGCFRIHGAQKTSTQISSTGADEMRTLRQRALGRIPSRLEVRLRVAPYLLRSKMRELRG